MDSAFLHQASTWLGLILGVISLGTVLFNAGRWSGRMERAEKHMHKMENQMQSLLPREIHMMAMASIERQIADLAAEVKAANKANHSLLARLVGHGHTTNED